MRDQIIALNPHNLTTAILAAAGCGTDSDVRIDVDGGLKPL